MDPVRQLVADTCARRAELELRGAAAFTLVTQSLIELGADCAIVELSARAIVEEMNHSEIYRSLANTYGGVEVPRPRPAPIEVPRYHGVEAALRPALHVVGMCAINETMACGFLQLCLDGATAPDVRAGLREVLSDEIRHGRIGWAWLGCTHVSDRPFFAAWVLPLLRLQLRGWRAQIATLPDTSAPEYGCPSKTAIESAALRAIADLVLPGFEHAGIDVAPSRNWLHKGAPT
jgi:hypothetical protein